MNTNRHSGKSVPGATDDRGGRPRSLWKGPAFITALVLLIPMLGNRFVDGGHWEPGFFVVVGALLFCIGLTYQLVTRNAATPAYRAATGVALVAAFVLVWLNFIQAADDVIPAAMMYLWVPLVGIIGAAMARLRPAGMARALFATALTQASILAMILIRTPPVPSWTSAVWRGFGLNAFFVLMFAGSALLFRKAARRREFAQASTNAA